MRRKAPSSGFTSNASFACVSNVGNQTFLCNVSGRTGEIGAEFRAGVGDNEANEKAKAKCEFGGALNRSVSTAT
jgi:hypothetical protein